MALTPPGQALQTSRLNLRWLTLDDADFMLAIWNDAEFLQYVGDRGIRTREEAQRALKTGPLKLYRDYAYGPYKLSLRGDDTPIGVCGLFRRDYLDDPDIGFAILPDYRRAGYATEAAMAVAEHAKSELGLKRLAAIVSPGHAVSIGVIGKIGLRFEKTIRNPAESEEIELYSVNW